MIEYFNELQIVSMQTLKNRDDILSIELNNFYSNYLFK